MAVVDTTILGIDLVLAAGVEADSEVAPQTVFQLLDCYWVQVLLLLALLLGLLLVLLLVLLLELVLVLLLELVPGQYWLLPELVQRFRYSQPVVRVYSCSVCDEAFRQGKLLSPGFWLEVAHL